MKNVLVINAGSSSLKYQLFDIDTEKVLSKGLAERIGISSSALNHRGKKEVRIVKDMRDHNDAIHMVLEALVDPEVGVVKDLSEIVAVGHRVVHGGETFNSSQLIDEKVLAAIEENIPLAPLHNPANIMGIKACMAAMPGVPQVAVFDTAFHQTMPPRAYIYGVPYEADETYKVRRYGFHGTSHLFVSQRAIELLGNPEHSKIVTCHLGNGSSIAAIQDGKSIDTSMGMTPLEGVVMGTRSGDIDPAIVKFIMDKEQMSIQEADSYFNKRSGVYGISGVSSDFRDIADAAQENNARAELALEVFAYHVKKYIGSYASAMGGLDCVVFTAGIGENDSAMRARILENMEWLGIEIDPWENDKRGEHEITKPGSKVRVFVIPTNEELVIARDTLRLIPRA